MIDENFVIVAGIIASLGSLIYLFDTIKGKAKPNRVTFFFWTLGPLVAFSAQLKEGVGIQSLLTFIAGFFPLTILIASFINKKSYWKIGRFDLLCGFLALIGLILWQITKDGLFAIIFGVLADGFAGIPTVIKSYYFPETESMYAYLATIVATVITILTIDTWTFSYYGFPVYLLLISFIIFIFIKFKLGKVVK